MKRASAFVRQRTELLRGGDNNFPVESNAAGKLDQAVQLIEPLRLKLSNAYRPARSPAVGAGGKGAVPGGQTPVAERIPTVKRHLDMASGQLHYWGARIRF
jgi:hypothetical protein